MRSLVAAINRPEVVGEIGDANEVRIGHATVVPATGTRVYALGAADRSCGLWIAGPARLEYVVDDPNSIALVQRSLKVGKGYDFTGTEGAVTVTMEVQELVVWTLADSPEIEPLEEDVPFSPWATSFLSEAAIGEPGSELLAAGQISPEVKVALVRGKAEDFRLNVDPVESGMESFYWLKRLKAAYGPFKGERAEVQIAAQPSGRNWRQRPQPLWLIDRLASEVTNPRGENLMVSTKFALRAVRDGLRYWRGYLPNNVLDNRQNRQPVRVQQVLVDGHPADFTHRQSELVVDVGRVLQSEERVMMEVAYQGDFAIRYGERTHWRLDPGLLFPGWHGDLRGDFMLSVNVPENLVPFASGSELSRETSGGRTVLRTRSEQPGTFPTVIVGDYHLQRVNFAGRTCRIAPHVFKQEEPAERVGQLVLATQDYLEKLFATPYPYQDLVVVEIDSWGWGQAPYGVIYITRDAFSPISQALVTPGHFSMGVNERIAHEVAHGWWGGVVFLGADNDWIIEGLAQYSAALAIRSFTSEADREREFNRAVREWRNAAKQIGPGASLQLQHGLSGWDPSAGVDAWRLRYAKAPLVFQAIRERLVDAAGKEEGDRQFVSTLQILLERFRGTAPHTQDIVTILKGVSGLEWQSWFDRYVYGAETPDVEFDS